MQANFLPNAVLKQISATEDCKYSMFMINPVQRYDNDTECGTLASLIILYAEMRWDKIRYYLKDKIRSDEIR